MPDQTWGQRKKLIVLPKASPLHFQPQGVDYTLATGQDIDTMNELGHKWFLQQIFVETVKTVIHYYV